MNSFKVLSADMQSLYSLLKEADIFFTPKLSEQIDLIAYSKKIIENGITVEFWHNSLLQGCVAGYINNDETKESYITFVYVNVNYRNKGIANQLIDLFIQEVKKRKYKKIILKCNKDNLPALSLYEKNKFKIKSEFNDIKYILEKVL